MEATRLWRPPARGGLSAQLAGGMGAGPEGSKLPAPPRVEGRARPAGAEAVSSQPSWDCAGPSSLGRPKQGWAPGCAEGPSPEPGGLPGVQPGRSLSQGGPAAAPQAPCFWTSVCFLTWGACPEHSREMFS